jgi:hypothetical protein
VVHPTSDIPANAITHGCGSWWTGAERSHCGSCHRTFTALTAFEIHRRGLRCNEPASVHLVARQMPFGDLWGQPVDEAQRARLAELRTGVAS